MVVRAFQQGSAATGIGPSYAEHQNRKHYEEVRKEIRILVVRGTQRLFPVKYLFEQGNIGKNFLLFDWRTAKNF